MTAPKWKLKIINIEELTDYFKNPRKITEEQREQLKKSLDEFGMIDKPVVNLDEDHTVIGGHQRLQVLRAENIKQVECWVPSRPLKEKEIEELNIRLNKNTGEWDLDILTEDWRLEDLLDWGFKKFELGIVEDPLNIAEEWNGMPEFDQKEIKPLKSLVVHFMTTEDIKSFADLIAQTVTEKTRSIWYPKQDFDQYGTKEGLVYSCEP